MGHNNTMNRWAEKGPIYAMRRLADRMCGESFSCMPCELSNQFNKAPTQWLQQSVETENDLAMEQGLP